MISQDGLDHWNNVLGPRLRWKRDLTAARPVGSRQATAASLPAALAQRDPRGDGNQSFSKFFRRTKDRSVQDLVLTFSASCR